MAEISRRTLELGTEQAFEVLAEVERLRGEGRSVISFAIGQPDFITPAYIREAGRRAMEAGHTGYTPSAGIPELRQAVAGYLSAGRGVAVEADEVTVACGAKPFIMYTIASVTDPGAGHEVLHPVPGFPVYASQIVAQGAVPVALPLLERRAFSFDPQALRAALSPRSRLLILNSPHNPTGRTLTREELEVIAGIVRPYPDLWILSDEIYSGMVHDGEFASIASLPGMAERTVIMDGLSKSYAMTGWRLGFAANRRLAPYFAKWITNTDSCASSIAQWAGVRALTGPQAEHMSMMASFKRRRGLMLEGLNGLEGVHALTPGGAFYLWPNVSGLTALVGAEDAEELRRRLLDEAGVAVLADRQFGPARPGGGDYLRLCYAASEADIEEGIGRISDWIIQAAKRGGPGRHGGAGAKKGRGGTAASPAARPAETAQELLEFWFSLKNPGKKDDGAVLQCCGPLHELAAKGALEGWAAQPRPRLALILLLDQVPRHLYREQPQSYATDAMARELTGQFMKGGDWEEFLPLEKFHALLPWLHSEEAGLQERINPLFHEVAPLIPSLDFMAGIADLYLETIRRFGRFPHRNVMLGRESTPEELLFLSKEWRKGGKRGRRALKK